MKIEISGSRCIGCHHYNQYYQKNHADVIEAIDRGFCGQRQCETRPGNRCKHYMERSNVGAIYRIKMAEKKEASV